jgi:hypothetical protein
VDLDFVVAEYNHGKPVALCEYKDKHAKPPNISHPTYLALADLADGYGSKPIPFFIATYCPVDWWFVITPVNDRAQYLFSRIAGAAITEQGFVTMLYRMRKIAMQRWDYEAISKLNNILP